MLKSHYLLVVIVIYDILHPNITKNINIFSENVQNDNNVAKIIYYIHVIFKGNISMFFIQFF